MRSLWNKFERDTRIALAIGLVLAVASIPLHALLALTIGLVAAAVLGFVYPDAATRVGVAVAVPVLTMAFLAAIIRGFGFVIVLVVLGCSLILPVYVARFGAGLRSGSR